MTNKKKHTCKEGGAHLRISFWYLLNLKNKWLLEKLLKWVNKKQIILIFTMLHFLKKIKKNTCRYYYQNLDDMIYSSWDIEQNKLIVHKGIPASCPFLRHPLLDPDSPPFFKIFVFPPFFSFPPPFKVF